MPTMCPMLPEHLCLRSFEHDTDYEPNGLVYSNRNFADKVSFLC